MSVLVAWIRTSSLLGYDLGFIVTKTTNYCSLTISNETKTSNWLRLESTNHTNDLKTELNSQNTSF